MYESKMCTIPPLPSKAGIITILAIFFIVMLCIYGTSLGNDFVRWDDYMLIYENHFVRAINFSTLKTIFTSYDPELYIPLTFFSYQIDYLISGTNPAFYHFHNLVLHTLNALCVLWIVYLLTAKRWVAILCGALFAIHPLHTEAVAWASARKDVLSTFFFLLSTITYLYYRGAANKQQYYLASIGTFLLSLMAKVTVVVLPIVLLLIDFRNRRKWDRTMLTDKIPYLALSIVFGIIAIYGKLGVIPRSSLTEKVLMAGKSSVFYIQKIFVPTKLSVLYPYIGDITITSTDFLVPLILIILLAIAAFYSLRWTREIFFGFSFFLITVAPTFVNFAKGPLDVYFASDRYTYMGSIGILYLFALLIDRLVTIGEDKFKHAKTVAVVVVTIICAVFAVLAFNQSLVWKNSETLFNDVLKKYPISHVAHNNVANAYLRRGEVQQAIEHYKEAIQIRGYAKTLSNLASAYRAIGQIDDAISLYNQAIELTPDTPQAHLGLGIIHAQLGEVDEALTAYTKALEYKPLFPEAHLNIGALHAQLVQYDQAIQAYQKAIEINPFLPHAYYNLGVVLSKVNRRREAMEVYERAVELQPAFVAARINLGIMYYERKKVEEAVEQFTEVLKYDPNNARARSALEQIKALR